jgi:hypothetical protein
MSARWNDSPERRRPRHAGTRLAWWRRPGSVQRRYEADHGVIGASPRPGRHRYVQFVDAWPRPTRHDTVAMPLVSAFVPLAGVR